MVYLKMLFIPGTKDKRKYIQTTTDPGSSTDQNTTDIVIVNGTEAIETSKTESVVSM